MNIGDAAAHTGLPAKTIRYYEDIGLLVPNRGANGYRDFDGKAVHKLVFLGRARALGFSIKECRSLLALYEDEARASADVKEIAIEHLGRIEAKLADLKGLHDTLSHLVDACNGDDRPDCPILTKLGGADG